MIEPTHIAEYLIAEMYNRSSEVRALFAEQLSRVISLPDKPTAVPNLQLSACARFRFDGAHKIDIAILDKTHFSCIPCEAKLGNDRLGKREFQNRFLKSCLTSHRNSRIAGSMIAILERKLPSPCFNAPVLVSHEGRDYQVASPWILIMRKTIHDSWKKYGVPSLSPACIHVSFEAIVEAVGGKTPFNSLVGELVSFDYYKTWMV
jgi:hypothetical protein